MRVHVYSDVLLIGVDLLSCSGRNFWQRAFLDGQTSLVRFAAPSRRVARILTNYFHVMSDGPSRPEAGYGNAYFQDGSHGEEQETDL